MQHVVIIGGGYGGVAAVGRLSKEQDLRITLIDQHPYHFLQTEGYALVAGRLPFDHALVNLQTLCAGYGEEVSFLHAKITDINLTDQKLFYHDGGEISYDFLIVATGSVTRFLSQIEGLRESSHGVKSLSGAFKMKQFFENELLLRLENAHQAKAYYSVVIGGAGLSGVEIAAEMQYYFNRYYKSNTLACDTLQIHLISGSDILKGLHPEVVKHAQNRLERVGVIIHKGAHIAKVEAHDVILEDGEKIAFDFMIFTGGITAAPLLQKLNLPLNNLGQIIVAETLQLPGYARVFVIGDSAQISDKKGQRIPDTAHAAIKSAEVAAENIVLMRAGKEPQKADITIQGLAIALGGGYAILDMGWIRVYGQAAHFMKKCVENLYKWPLWFRCRIGFRKHKSCLLKEK